MKTRESILINDRLHILTKSLKSNGRSIHNLYDDHESVKVLIRVMRHELDQIEELNEMKSRIR